MSPRLVFREIYLLCLKVNRYLSIQNGIILLSTAFWINRTTYWTHNPEVANQLLLLISTIRYDGDPYNDLWAAYQGHAVLVRPGNT